MARCDILALTSKFEGLPNVLLEAMVLKKFIISSNCPTGPKEILQNGKYGFLFKVGDHKSFSKKIYKYLKEKKRAQEMIRKGYLNLKKYDFEDKCNVYLNCINNYLID